MNRLPQDRYRSGTARHARGEAPSLAAQHQQMITEHSWAGHASHLSSQTSRPILTPSDPSAVGPQILVIDDSPTIRSIMEVCHKRAGFSIQTFADGIEVFKLVLANQTLTLSLIYLDIEMPCMDGFDVARRLHARPALAGVPILMFSGRDKMLDRLKGLLAGAKGYVTKPFREQDILALTRSYLSPVASGSVTK